MTPVVTSYIYVTVCEEGGRLEDVSVEVATEASICDCRLSRSNISDFSVTVTPVVTSYIYVTACEEGGRLEDVSVEVATEANICDLSCDLCYDRRVLESPMSVSLDWASSARAEIP